MKNNNKYILLLICISTLFVSCGDEIGYSASEAQRSPNFVNTNLSVPVPEEDLILDIPVAVTSVSSSDRVYQIEVISFTGSSSEYSYTSAIIPANQIEGIAQVSFDFSEITDSDLREVKLKMLNPNGAPSNEITIEYFREVICNDLELTIISDVWATETYVTIEQADGTPVVTRFFPFSNNSTTPQEYNQAFTLADGDYVLKIGDTYGDGNTGTGGGVTLDGSYELICSIITHASGGVFTSGEPDPFPGNPDAIVEVTNFSVNP